MAMMVPMAKPEPRLGREIGERLDALRRAHGWTQGQLVIKTGLDKSTVYQILAGARKDPPVGTMSRFADAFNVSVDEIIGRKPLEMPEIQPDLPESDRLAKLEDQVARLTEALAPALDALAAQTGSREQSRGTQPQRTPRQRRPA